MIPTNYIRAVKPIPHEHIFCGKFFSDHFIGQMRLLKNRRASFYVAKKKCIYAKVCSCAPPVTENLPHTQGLAVAFSVLSPLSIIISGVQANEVST